MTFKKEITKVITMTKLSSTEKKALAESIAKFDRLNVNKKNIARGKFQQLSSNLSGKDLEIVFR